MLLLLVMCDHWEDDASDNNLNCSIYTDGDKSVHAVLAPNSPLTYSLTVNAYVLAAGITVERYGGGGQWRGLAGARFQSSKRNPILCIR
jgi:hypothetical protein